MNVNLYIETKTKGYRKAAGVCAYVLEYQMKNGKLHTRSYKVKYKETTVNRLYLHAMISALDRLTTPCNVKIYMNCDSVETIIKTGLINTWAEHDWRNPSGKEPKNVKLWIELHRIINRHVLVFTKESNSYKSWLEMELNAPTNIALEDKD